MTIINWPLTVSWSNMFGFVFSRSLKLISLPFWPPFLFNLWPTLPLPKLHSFLARIWPQLPPIWSFLPPFCGVLWQVVLFWAAFGITYVWFGPLLKASDRCVSPLGEADQSLLCESVLALLREPKRRAACVEEAAAGSRSRLAARRIRPRDWRNVASGRACTSTDGDKGSQ